MVDEIADHAAYGRAIGLLALLEKEGEVRRLRMVSLSGNEQVFEMISFDAFVLYTTLISGRLRQFEKANGL